MNRAHTRQNKTRKTLAGPLRSLCQCCVNNVECVHIIRVIVHHIVALNVGRFVRSSFGVDNHPKRKIEEGKVDGRSYS